MPGFTRSFVAGPLKCRRFSPDPRRPKSCPKGETYQTLSGYRKSDWSHCDETTPLYGKMVNHECDQGE